MSGKQVAKRYCRRWVKQEILSYIQAILALRSDCQGPVVEAGCYVGGSTAKFSIAAGSNQGDAGGDKCVEALWCNGSLLGDLATMQAETRVNAGPTCGRCPASKDQIAGADPAVFRGRPPPSGEEATDAPSGPAGVTTLRAVPASACL